MNAPVVKRGADGRLLPGGPALNPGGRPKGIEAVRELLGEHTPTFVAALVGLLQSPNETTRLAAFREFMDRLVGKPVQISDSNVKTQNLDIPALYLLAMQGANKQMGDGAIDVTPEPDARAGVEW
jgi:hypothetical protein